MSRAEWLAALDSVSRKPDLSRDIARLLDRGVADPPAFLASLFGRAGISYSFDAQGIPRLPEGNASHKNCALLPPVQLRGGKFSHALALQIMHLL